MNIETNEALIRRNARIAQVALLGGLVVLAGGMVISFQNPEQFGISMAALLIGFLLSQLGIYFANRWGRRPRPDELLNQALKGLDGRFTLYHYKTPVSHLLIGPAGIWILMPRHHRGVIVFEKGRWRQKGGGILLGYMKIFAQEGLGRPDLEMQADIESLRSFLSKKLDDGEVPPIQAALVFTNDKADLQVKEEDNPTAPALQVAKLKEFIRKKIKEKPVSLTKIQEITQILTEN